MKRPFITGSFALGVVFFPFASSFSPPKKHISTAFSSCCSATLQETTADDNMSKNKIVDQSTLLLLEHININVPSHEYILPFYFDLLGCGMDPRKAENLKSDAPKKTLWANCGASQFHLPYGDVAQRIPGQIGLSYASLEGLKARVAREEKKDNASCIKESEIGVDEASGREYVRLVDRYDNVFYCRQKVNGATTSRADGWKQPVIAPSDTETWQDVAKRFGRDTTDCLGIDYVEFNCPMGTAEKISLFYDAVLDATTCTSALRGTNDGGKYAIIALGNVDENGRADQSLLFRETSQEIPPYDGHHIAIYVGESAADFEQAFRNAETAGIVWVNPRFSDKTENIQGARKWKQFRFKDIIDMKTGEKIYELEHEMRSIEHESFPGHNR